MQIPNAQKRQSSQQCRLALLGPTFVKAVCRALMKSTPGLNFINILLEHFAPIFCGQKLTKPNVTREKLLNLLLYEKRSSKMLMKSTPEM